MMALNFYKMHNLGNDFIMLDLKKQNQLISPWIDMKNMELNPNFIKLISNRHTGIGCDQLGFFNLNPEERKVEISLYNQDGSKVTMCINLLLCLSKILNSTYDMKQFVVSIKGNPRQIQAKFEDHSFLVLDYHHKDNNFKELIENEFNQIGLKFKYFDYIDVGNPHLVLILEDSVEIDRNKLSRMITEMKIFKDGININFVKIFSKNTIELQVYERGVGFTYSCGSGAVASFIVCNNLGFVNDSIEVRFKYGNLKLEFNSKREISISSDPVCVFEGKYYLK